MRAVRVQKVRVPMPQRSVDVPVRVRRAKPISGMVDAVVMLVMRVRVSMRKRLVHLPMIVPLGEVQPDPLGPSGRHPRGAAA
jgi:hypothetical protein